MQDVLGNPVTNGSPAALSGINDFVSGFLSYETKAVNILAAADADPDCALANIYAGMLWMFLEAPDAPQNAAGYIISAAQTLPSADRREQALHALLVAWAANDMPRAEQLAADIVVENPSDLATMKLGQYFAFNRGDAPTMLRLAKSAEAANQKNPYLHGMIAFGYEQCHLLEKAERSARRAMELKRAEPWAHHALAHVMLTEGRVPEGAAFLDEVADTWNGLNSFMYTHNWWHRALFSISLGDYEAVIDAYDTHCWTQEKTYSQDQIGAVSLLARMEFAGIDVGERWADLADWLKVRQTDTVQPFLTLQYLYGLARAERGEADELMQAIEDKAKSAAGFERKAWADVALPAARGILASVRGRHEEAVHDLTIALPRMAEIGGSHAQRDLFEQIMLDAQMNSGNLVAAQQMLEMRRTYDPCGIPLNRMLASTYRRLGLGDEAEEAEARRYS